MATKRKTSKLRDAQMGMQAMQQQDGKDSNDLVGITAKGGASSQPVIGLKQKILDQQKAYSDIAQNDDAEIGSKRLEAMKRRELTYEGIHLAASHWLE